MILSPTQTRKGVITLELQKIEQVTKNEISIKRFSTIDVVDYPAIEQSIYKLRDHDINGLPPESNEQMIKLRKKLDYIFHTVLKGSFEFLYENCDINETTFRKFIKGSRNLSKTNLVKFIIGTGIDQDTAEELLRLNETPFDYDNRFDYIVACAIRDGDTLDTLHEDLIKYGCKGLRIKNED